MSDFLLHGDCREVLATIADATFDSVVTDPPYELGFMGKRWDASGVAYDVTLWAEVLRVLKPGGHLLAFGGTRTYHRMAVAIEDAGFEIRDSIHWLYGSGFPKSLDVSKAIDKAAGVCRTDRVIRFSGQSGSHENPTRHVVSAGSPATDAARTWEGWGTALKPAHEPIVLARKPFPGTVAANVLQHGTGALNIDGCRIGDGGGTRAVGFVTKPDGRLERWDEGFSGARNQIEPLDVGRWPANVILDDWMAEQHPQWANYFYCPKASTSERNDGLDGLPEKETGKFAQDQWTKENMPFSTMSRNFHPTVKPLELMRWLVRLVTPPDGRILDPFAGSGTTLAAAILEGFNPTGIELTADYMPIIEARIRWAQTQPVQTRLDI